MSSPAWKPPVIATVALAIVSGSGSVTLIAASIAVAAAFSV